MRALLLIVLAALVGSASSVRAEVVPAAIPDDSASVVVSIALSSGILDPAQFPIAGRDCRAVLAELRRSERFAGEIRATYEPPADPGRCFNLRGKNERVAVVCCAPRARP